MINETMIFIGCFALSIILIIKTWNVVNKATFYDKKGILITFLLSIIFWGFSFFGFINSLGEQSTSVIIDGANTITVTQSQNAYVYLFVFQDIQNALVWAIFGLTLIEIVYLFDINKKSRKEGRLKN